MEKAIIEYTIDLVGKQATLRPMSSEELAGLLENTFMVLNRLYRQETNDLPVVVPENDSTVQFNNPNDSIQYDKVICLVCGQEFRQISFNHLMKHGLTVTEYKTKFGIFKRKSLTCGELAEARSDYVRTQGLAQKMKEARRKKKEERQQNHEEE